MLLDSNLFMSTLASCLHFESVEIGCILIAICVHFCCSEQGQFQLTNERPAAERISRRERLGSNPESPAAAATAASGSGRRRRRGRRRQQSSHIERQHYESEQRNSGPDVWQFDKTATRTTVKYARGYLQSGRLGWSKSRIHSPLVPQRRLTCLLHCSSTSIRTQTGTFRTILNLPSSWTEAPPAAAHHGSPR